MKKSQIDKALEQLAAEIAVLQQVYDRLKAQQVTRVTRKPRAVKSVERSA